MSTTERSSFSLKKGVGLRPVNLPTPPPQLVTELIDPNLVPPVEAEPELGAGQGSGLSPEPEPVVPAPVITTVHTPVNTPAQHTVRTEQFQAVTQTRLPVNPGVMRERRKKTTTVTFRFPLEMVDRLRSLADYNGVSQTAILLEALELHLPAFRQPPADWQATR